MPAMLRVIRKMGLADVAAAMEDELSMVRYYWHSKQTKDRSDDPAPRRWEACSGVLPRGLDVSLPWRQLLGALPPRGDAFWRTARRV